MSLHFCLLCGDFEELNDEGICPNCLNRKCKQHEEYDYEDADLDEEELDATDDEWVEEDETEIEGVDEWLTSRTGRTRYDN